MTWHAVDGSGLALATGCRPQPPGAPSPAAALAAAPVATWPLDVVDDAGRHVDLAAAFGPGGARVVVLLDRVGSQAPPPVDLDLVDLARTTPGGQVGEALTLMGLTDAVDAAAHVDADWLAVVEECRVAPRTALVAAGRETELEAALHLAMLLATGPIADDRPPEARVASGARLWLLGGAVAWALLGTRNDPFAAWGDLVSYGIWPVGPVGGRLVVHVDRTPAPRGPDGPASTTLST